MYIAFTNTEERYSPGSLPYQTPVSTVYNVCVGVGVEIATSVMTAGVLMAGGRMPPVSMNNFVHIPSRSLASLFLFKVASGRWFNYQNHLK